MNSLSSNPPLTISEHCCNSASVVSRLQEMQNCICLQPHGAQSGWWFKSAAASEDGRELERLQRAGRIWERVCLQAASQARPRMCCKTVVKQIGHFLLFASHDICFSLSPLPLPPLPPPLLSLWMDCLTHTLPFCGAVCCVGAAREQECEAGRNRNVYWV